ncbi:hypothetical protein [Micromonospora sp. NPDC048839]
MPRKKCCQGGVSGLRERKKAETRAALTQAALEQFTRGRPE